MNIIEALPVGTVVKLKEVDKRVVIIGIMQQAEDNGKTETYDYIGVPYPEGFLGAASTVLFQQPDIETIFYIGFADIERQNFIAEVSEQLNNESTK